MLSLRALLPGLPTKGQQWLQISTSEGSLVGGGQVRGLAWEMVCQQIHSNAQLSHPLTLPKRHNRIHFHT